tara:strand:- start:4735 stop:5169 length:435 start_codon:yes stop_codon:yes gene_type:complete
MISIVRKNLLTRVGYTPYCVNIACVDTSRSKFDGEQFKCESCDWRSEFESEFIKKYLKFKQGGLTLDAFVECRDALALAMEWLDPKDDMELSRDELKWLDDRLMRATILADQLSEQTPKTNIRISPVEGFNDLDDYMDYSGGVI